MRHLPLGMQDWILYRSLGLAKLEPVLLQNAKDLRSRGGAGEA